MPQVTAYRWSRGVVVSMGYPGPPQQKAGQREEQCDGEIESPQDGTDDRELHRPRLKCDMGGEDAERGDRAHPLELREETARVGGRTRRSGRRCDVGAAHVAYQRSRHDDTGNLAGMATSTPDHPSESRFSTADLIGPVLLFLGGFLLAVTIALPLFYVPGLRTIPLHTDVTTVARSTGSSTVFDQCSVDGARAETVQTSVTRSRRVVAVQPSDADRVTLQAGTSLRADEFLDDCNDATLVAVRDRVTLDRRTAAPDLADGGSSEIQYDDKQAAITIPDRRGMTYVLPFDVAAADAEYFDVITRSTVPLRYAGETQVSGRTASKFTAAIPDTDLHAVYGDQSAGRPTVITRPASWFGAQGNPAREITATLHHRGDVELAVDPVTGTILDERITIDEQYRPAGANPENISLTNLSTTLTYSDRTRSQMASVADDQRMPITIWGRLVPIATGVLAVLAFGAGVVLLSPARARRLGARLRR